MTFLNRTFDNHASQNRSVEPFFGRFHFVDESLRSGTWAPPVDVAEEKDRILVKVEVPGVDEKDLRVHYEDGTLTISGERTFEKREDLNYHRIERAYGSFVRTFTLSRAIDPSQIVAEYKNGVLSLEIPKKEEAKPRQIEINVGTRAAG